MTDAEREDAIAITAPLDAALETCLARWGRADLATYLAAWMGEEHPPAPDALPPRDRLDNAIARDTHEHGPPATAEHLAKWLIRYAREHHAAMVEVRDGLNFVSVMIHPESPKGADL